MTADRIADSELQERRGEGGLSWVQPESSSRVESARKLVRRRLGVWERRANEGCRLSGWWHGQHLLVASVVRSILGAERDGLCLLGRYTDNPSPSSSLSSMSYLPSSLHMASPNFSPYLNMPRTFVLPTFASAEFLFLLSPSTLQTPVPPSRHSLVTSSRNLSSSSLALPQAFLLQSPHAHP